jgi:CheY-like chemotaxis protein
MLTNQMIFKPIDILLVEDNPGDVRLTKEALLAGRILNRIYVARDGVEALDFLRREGKFAGQPAPRPDIILLDLNMPRMDGRQCLEIIKADANLRRIPVVILTTSEADQDVLRSYDLHANCYIAKPVDMSQFIKVVQSIKQFWFSIVNLPADGI